MFCCVNQCCNTQECYVFVVRNGIDIPLWCHGGVFERALVPECLHTHTCAARGLRASAPSRVCPIQWSRRKRFASIAHGFTSIACGVQHSLSDKGFYHNIENGNWRVVHHPQSILHVHSNIVFSNPLVKQLAI